MKNWKYYLIPIVITLIIGLVLYYFWLPALNVHSPGFWSFITVLVVVYVITSLVGLIDIKGNIVKNVPKNIIGTVIVLGSILLIILIINFFNSPLFKADIYANRITINEDAVFTDDVQEVDFSKIPLLDKESSQKLGDRVMGEMPELVSQFYVSDLYTQISYNNTITRVTPLEYSGIIKYFTNRSEGVKGYILVDSVNGDSTLVKLDKGMKYMPSSLFNEDLYRKLRFSYPTSIFGDISFEIDDEGNPYWIASVIDYIGVGLKEEVVGVVILDPITGKSKMYKNEEVPSWVDHVQNAEIILEQVNDWGQYRDGFLNSIFGQKNVVATTEGYNYMVQNDDVYLYTGITSVLSDESNIGFILTNMRTKETKYYAIPGAEEYSAMYSALGQVQQMNYNATFPLLVNLKGRPTYLISLKDAAGLVKMYAFVDVQNYQKVSVTDSSKGIVEASRNYINNVGIATDSSNLREKVIKISYIKEANIEGNTYYYIKDIDNQKYRVSIKVNEGILPFLEKNDKISIGYSVEDEIVEIITLK